MTDATEADAGAAYVSIVREFDAPRALVFKFWTTPALLARWFGPDDYHTPEEEISIEPQVSGRFHLPMVRLDASERHWMYGVIEELVEPERLTIAVDVPHPQGLPPLKNTIRVLFHDLGGRTRVELVQGPFPVEAARHETRIGWGQSFQKLDRALASA